MRPARPSIILLLTIPGCCPSLTTPQHPRPFHTAVGCWRIMTADSLPDYEARLFPVTVRLSPEAALFYYHPGAVRPWIDFRLDLLAGPRNTHRGWEPLRPDTIAIHLDSGGHNVIAIRAGITGDSLSGLGSVGAGNTRARMIGSRIKC
jgi:hypothetical protein